MKLFEGKKIKTKLTMGFVIVIIVSLVLSATGIVYMTRAGLNQMKMQKRFDSMPEINEAMQECLSVQSLSNAIVLNAAASNQTKVKELTESMKQCSTAYTKAHESVMATVNLDEWKTKLKAAKKLYDETYYPMLEKAAASAAENDVTAASADLEAASTNGDKILDVYDKFSQNRVKTATEEYNGITAESTVSFVLIIIFTIAGVILSIIICKAITKSINNPLKELAKCADGLVKGDLTVRSDYTANDEIGLASKQLNESYEALQKVISEVDIVLSDVSAGKLDRDKLRSYKGDFGSISESLNTIIDNLNKIFASIKHSADQVGSGSSEVANGAQALAQGATEQASAAEELSSTVEEVSSKVKENTHNITAIASEMSSTADKAATGNSQMKQMLDSMNRIATSSEEIGKIIKVIDNIAFQTNILALNASVEAARAGEAGKGFAVVADEVRNLATKSADAAKQTANLIETSTSQVQEGQGLAENTAQALAEIAESIKSVNERVQKVETASKEQANSIMQITQGIDQVSSVIQTNSATAQESAAASEELSKQASNLTGEVGWIHLRVEAAGSSAAASSFETEDLDFNDNKTSAKY